MFKPHVIESQPTMPFQLTTLSNGLRVATYAQPSLATAAVGVWVRAGSRDEQPAEHGLSHLLEHMAFKGTPTRSALDIAEQFDAIGGRLNAYTSSEQTVYHAHVLQEDAALALEILADIVLRPTFPEDELQRERHVVLQEIAMTNDTPDDLVFDLFQTVNYPDHPLGRPILGTVETVSGFSRENLQHYCNAHYHAANMVVAAAGNVAHDAIVAAAEAQFHDIPQDGAVAGRPAPSFSGGEHRENKALEQLHLVMGLPGFSYHDDDYIALQVLGTILGGGLSSRLFQEVREKRGLAYSVGASVSGYGDDGVFTVYAGTGEKEVADMVPVICGEITNLPGTLRDEEITRAKNQLRAGLLMSREGSASLCETVGTHMLRYGRFIPSDELRADIDAVTRADVLRVLERILTGAALSLAALGPTDTLEPYETLQARLAA